MEKVVANGVFNLVGTENQVSILEPVFTPGAPDYIAFPWERLGALRNKPVPISWDDLNDGTMGVRARAGGPIPVHPRMHEDDDEGHAISRPGTTLGEPTQRLMIAGVFWTDGRIKIDIRMENRPSAAREVMSAELAHAVDYGLPLTDSQKNALVNLLHSGGTDQHTWWEKQDYGTEYYTLVGESFMAMFTHAFSKMEPWQDPFPHKSSASLAPAIHSILGIQPVGSQPQTDSVAVYSLKGYKTFHRERHYVAAWRSKISTRSRIVQWANRRAAIAAGMVACKTCKP